MTVQLLDWVVWATPLIAIPFIPLIGRLDKTARNYFVVAVSFTTALIAVSLLLTSPLPRESSLPWLSTYGFVLQVRVDGLSIFLALIVNLLGALIVLYSLGYMGTQPGLDRYYALILLFIGSMTGLVMAGNFLQLYIFWEMVGICSSFLIAFWYDRPQAIRAGLKAFLVTRVGDIGLLIGLVYLYVNTGSISFAALESMAGNGSVPSTVFTIGGLLIFAGAMGKSAQFPLHVWLPDAMEGPSTVSALIHAATMVNAGIYLVARTYPIFSTSPTWLTTVGAVGITSALLAAPLAMAAYDLKRVLAYSTISQLGLMFAALGIGTSQGLFSSQFHLMSQGAFKALGFLAAGSVIHIIETRDMNQMGGLRRWMPLTFIAFAFSTFAMAGVPPFIGFWSKDQILAASLEAGNLVLFFLILLVSVMTAFYSFRALFRVFIVKPTSEIERKKPYESPRIMTVPLIMLSGAVLLLFVLEGSVANLLGASLETGPAPAVFASSLLALLLGLVPVYVVYWRNGDRSGQLIAQHSTLRFAQRVLLEGYGFDRFYEIVFVHPGQLVAAKIRNLQTGILGINLWALLLFLAAVLAVFLI